MLQYQDAFVICTNLKELDGREKKIKLLLYVEYRYRAIHMVLIDTLPIEILFFYC